jgi:hypothetical protein
MTAPEIRLECLRIAASVVVAQGGDATALARDYEAFVCGAALSSEGHCDLSRPPLSRPHT